jgi:hypothetical protein
MAVTDRELLERAARESCYKLKPPIWPFPKICPPIPLTKQQLAEDNKRGRDSLGEALF